MFPLSLSKPESATDGGGGGLKGGVTVAGHELEFVDQLYRRDEEGQGFTTTRLGSSQNVPIERQSKQEYC